MKIVTAALLCAAAACASAGCGSTGSDGAPRGGSDVEGVVLADAVRVSRIDRSTVNEDGKVRYWVENVTPVDQEDLAWSVSYLFPSRRTAGDEIMNEEAETTSERTLILLRDEKDKLLEAQFAGLAEMRAAGRQIIGTRLNLFQNPPVLTIARDDAQGQQGTRFLGRLECVGQSDIWDGSRPADQVVLEFENITNTRVADLELQVVFVDSRAKSKWRPIPSTEPGNRTKVTVDLRGLDRGDNQFLVKVRQQAL